MKLTRIRLIGRFTNPETGRKVNVHKGNRKGYGTDHLFYLYRQKRVFINDADFYGKWQRRVPEAPY